MRLGHQAGSIVTALIIANNRTEEMGEIAAMTPVDRAAGGCGTQRMLWFARDGDVVVLPFLSTDGYVDYVTSLTGTHPESLTLLAPPADSWGTDLLTVERLGDERFRSQLGDVLARRPVDEIVACVSNASVAELAVSLGIEGALPGHRFSAQGGAALANSKAVFRAVAAGAGVPTAPGAVVRREEQAEAVIAAFLARGHSVIVKQELAGGGAGNEILSPIDGIEPAGARKIVVLRDASEIRRYLAERWPWLTLRGSHLVVIERYFTGATPLYAEFLVTDEGCELRGTGEMLMDPVVVGEVVPPPSLTPAAHGELVEGGRRLCEAFRAIGFRGNMSADAILTSDGELCFNEANGRLTGGTHLHLAIRDRILGDDYRARRVLLERTGWKASSFPAALERLTAAGLAYQPTTRTGIIVTTSFASALGTLMYCVVAEDMAHAKELDRRLASLGEESEGATCTNVE